MTGRAATLSPSVGLVIAQSDFGAASLDAAGYAATSAAILAASWKPTVSTELELTDLALGVLEAANEAAGRAPYPLPPADVIGLVTELQVRYDGEQRPEGLADTRSAFDEVLRLQGYLMPGGPEEESSIHCAGCHRPVLPLDSEYRSCFRCRSARSERKRRA